jgi:hypothetical protein
MWLDKKGFFEGKTIEQVLRITGDGTLRDGNDASIQLREFFGSIPSPLLFQYINHCLYVPFENSGFVLQDLVNQLGSRLGYKVENGCYRGSTKRVGSDGLWRGTDDHNLVVEVKTTDAYQMNLDTFAGYRQELIDAARIPKDKSSILIVVGRKDTGGLEAQTRGSRHAWDIRLISVDALISLLKVKENLNDLAIVKQTQQILKPLEFTRLDSLVEIIFKTSEATQSPEMEENQPEEAEVTTDQKKAVTQPVRYHQECVARIEAHLRIPLVQQGRAAYASASGENRLICLVSKEYRRATSIRYWYAFHPAQKEFLEQGKQSFVALGCGSPKYVLLIPSSEFIKKLPKMRTTETNNRLYWHVEVFKKGDRFLLIRPTDEEGMDVTRFLLT